LELFRYDGKARFEWAKKGAGTRRIRYHQAMIDSHTLQSQEDPESLPNLYIIFILEHDFFNKGEALYRVIKQYDVQDSEGIKVVSQIVEEYGDERAAVALQQGLQQGAKQNAVENAQKLLADGKYSAEEISKLLGIPVESFAETTAV